MPSTNRTIDWDGNGNKNQFSYECTGVLPSVAPTFSLSTRMCSRACTPACVHVHPITTLTRASTSKHISPTLSPLTPMPFSPSLDNPWDAVWLDTENASHEEKELAKLHKKQVSQLSSCLHRSFYNQWAYVCIPVLLMCMRTHVLHADFPFFEYVHASYTYSNLAQADAQLQSSCADSYTHTSLAHSCLSLRRESRLLADGLTSTRLLSLPLSLSHTHTRTHAHPHAHTHNMIIIIHSNTQTSLAHLRLSLRKEQANENPIAKRKRKLVSFTKIAL